MSTKYTNHSIRATGATLLSRANYNNAQIMSVTGHKSTLNQDIVASRKSRESRENLFATLSIKVASTNCRELARQLKVASTKCREQVRQ